MSRRGRGSTRAGTPAHLPAGTYEPAPATEDASRGLVVRFEGEDGRSRVFPVAELPLSGWHDLIAAAVAARTGPAGTIRTLSSARALWAPLVRFIRFLDTLDGRPITPADLTERHLERFRLARAAKSGLTGAWGEVRVVGTVLKQEPLREHLRTEVLDYVGRRNPYPRRPPKPGYSDRELRVLLAAARTDVTNLRGRIDAGHQAAELSGDGVLARIASSGIVPPVTTGSAQQRSAERIELAGRLFLTLADMAPFLVLLVWATGFNVETIKELPVEHRVLDGRAVQLRILKRRRGQRRWLETVTWEIGPPNRELHTPGGLYLLLHRLTAPGRGFRGQTAGVWSVWRSGHSARVSGVEEHYNPFGRKLGVNLYADRWAARHTLTADTSATGGDEESGAAVPLPVDFNRIKTSVDVRRTRRMGGHLPSAARTNSVPVLFSNYLRGDPTTIAWAHDVMGTALADAEQSALAAHRRLREQAGGGPRIAPGMASDSTGGGVAATGLDEETAQRVGSGDLDTAWSACTDHDHHPATGRRCRESFLSCFHCGNCVITRAHLPRLLGLLDALTGRRQLLGDTEWWSRYGTTWAALRHDILTKFSPQELEHATADTRAATMLELIEAPWERP